MVRQGFLIFGDVVLWWRAGRRLAEGMWKMGWMVRRARFVRLAAFFALVALVSAPTGAAQDVLRATLPNGLKVVIVRNTLAPVVATSVNYLAGSDEAPVGFPGTAHAVEHMMFRGSPGLSAPQLSNIGSVMGGHYNANTREGMTQYYYHVPAEDLGVALHIEAARMAGIDASEADWQKERGAIEQEVSRDISSPAYKAYQQVRAKLFVGTPYAHTPLGSRETFDKTSAADLKAFHDAWYAPNNAVLVVVGDVQPKAALAEIRKVFGPLPAKKLPPRPKMRFTPVAPTILNVDSDQPYTMAYMALRLPGYDNRDEAALEVLTDVLQSKRFALYSLVADGKALATFFDYSPLKHAGTAMLGAAIPADGDARAIQAEMREVVARALKEGIPANLVEAAKLQERRQAEQEKNSISGLASTWADALVEAGLASPDAAMARIAKVTVADVNRVARQYLTLDTAMSVVLVSKGGGKPVAGGAVGGPESIALGDAAPVALPDWAQAALARLEAPHATMTPQVSTLPNGLTLIVQPTDVSDTVSLYGAIRDNPDMEEAAGKDGVASMLEALMGYGTGHLDRLAFQQAVDEIGASVHAGSNFSASALAKDFDRAVELLADNQLAPALPEASLAALKKQYVPFFVSRLQSPDYLAERAMTEALYPPQDPALRQITGASVAGLGRDDLLAYYRQVFRPDMAAIVVIGNITPSAARATVEKYFGGWRAAGPKPDVDPPAVAPNQAKTAVVPNAAKVQDEVTLAHTLALTRTNPDYYPLQLGNAVLGGGIFSAKLYKDLRVNSGLVYNVGSSLSAGRRRGGYHVSYGSDPENVSKANAIIVKDIKEMQNEALPPEALRDAKAYLVRQIPLEESSVRTIAGGYLHRFDLGLPYDEPVRAAQRIIAISPAEVQAAFKKWLRPDDLVRVTEGPDPK
jgi:zinc protease